MAERTVLDFYRLETSSPRGEHYSHWTPAGRRVLTTEQFFDRTAALAAALADLGVGRGDRVLLLSDNRPEWHMTDLATLSLSAVDVPIYGTLTPEQVAYQVNDSGARAAVVEGPEQMDKLLTVRSRCPGLEHLIQIEGPTADRVLPFDELVAGYDAGDAEAAFWDRAARVEPGDLMTIIYTSGTTGEPKGVMLTHDNLVQNVLHSAYRIPVTREDLALEFLPLCHVLERMVGYIYMWRETSKAYCSAYHVGDLLASIRPTLFAGVPRFYEKVMQRITDTVAAAPAHKRALYAWAVDLGTEASRLRLAGKAPSAILAARHGLADRLVLSKVREGLGGRLRFCVSGGAELPLFVNEFFHALGVFMVEGYGLTETSPVIAVNGAEPEEIRLGTVGRPLANLEVRLADDGELLVRGPSVMSGYWNKPEQTAEVFTDDGFFTTGDIAEIDDDGFLLIVDRKKDLIVTGGGKNVAPQPIESHLKRSPAIETAVLVGDRRPYVVALISPSFEELERWAKREGVEVADREELVALPGVRAMVGEAITGVNASLARYEQIKRFVVLPVTLSIEGGHLTPTLKVKRRVVEQQFAREIDRLYAD
ncbi:MAG: long-chain fatty acid--CoA ligase [Thermoanaerobaculales bacterium]|jgi:long-chain acyl-CoA synthetase|nr:long-chain fatty acid--CoA ligase [Thermoanaerobaculales bacterium]